MAERALPTTGYIILGLLTSRDWSAYEIAEQVGRGVDQLWPRADRQRYNTPKRLLELGLVTARTEATGRRTRTVYSITGAGRAELAAWLGRASRPPAMEFEGMVKVLLSEQGTVADLRATLGQMVEHATEARALFAAHAAFITATGGTFPERRHLFAMANRFMVQHYDHLIEWAHWALEQTEGWTDTSVAMADDEQVTAMLAPGLAVWAAIQAEPVATER